jgi:hypothetical protein
MIAITWGAGKTTELQKEETMSLSGAKSHHFIMTAILASALTLCWSAEAKPPNGGSKPLITDTIVKKVRYTATGGVVCYVYNPSFTREMCAVIDYYNSAWWFGFPAHARRIQRRLTGIEMRPITRAPLFQDPTLHCKLVSARYGPPYRSLADCPDQGF